MSIIKDRCNGKLSVALSHMLAGLRKAYAGIPGFRIDMSTYGRTSDGICYGCAATCTVQELANHIFTVKDYEEAGHLYSLAHSKYISHRSDLLSFESAIDHMRLGYPLDLLRYFEVPEQFSEFFENIKFDNGTYAQRFDRFEQIIKALESEGY